MNASNGVTVAEPKLAARISPLMVAIIVALHVGGIYLIANLDFWPLRFDSSGSLVMVRIIPHATSATIASTRTKPAATAHGAVATALQPKVEPSAASGAASSKP